MNEYTFEEIEIGKSEVFEVQITEEMHNSFTRITGDINPMHVDEDYADSHGFGGGRLVYGMLTASFYSTLVGVYLPGKHSLFYECDTMFNKPVHIGDILQVMGTVIQKDEVPNNRVMIKGIIKNQQGEIVSRAKLIVGVLK